MGSKSVINFLTQIAENTKGILDAMAPSKGPAPPGWISTKDQLPDPGQAVVVWDSKTGDYRLGICTRRKINYCDSIGNPTRSSILSFMVTSVSREDKDLPYWAPLPPKP